MNRNKDIPISAVIKKHRVSLRFALAATGLILLSACVSTPQPPTAALQAAELAIADADQARVTNFAALELSEARGKLNAARAAIQQENMTQALYLAEESEVEAQLASARADVIKAQTVNDQMHNSIKDLKLEMNRNTGEAQ